MTIRTAGSSLNSTALQKTVERGLAKRRHYSFMQYMWMGEKKFIHGKHIKTICDRLDKTIDDYRNGISTFLTIKVPFRHSKSTIISRYFPPHFIGQFPNDEIIVCTHTTSFVRTLSRFARNIIKSEEYRDLYPDVKISTTEQSVDMWGIEGCLGKVQWLGIESGVIGRGGDLIIVDDFFASREDANSEIMREKVWDSIINNIMTRRPDPCIVIILATPWHLDDPFGRIKEQMATNQDFPQFEEIKFPAKSDVYPSGYLWPEKFSKQWYESQFATLPPYYSSANLQCEPIPRAGANFT